MNQPEEWAAPRGPLPGVLKQANDAFTGEKAIKSHKMGGEKSQQHCAASLSISELQDSTQSSTGLQVPARVEAKVSRNSSPMRFVRNQISKATSKGPLSPATRDTPGDSGELVEEEAGSDSNDESKPSSTDIEAVIARPYRELEFEGLLSASVVKVDALRELTWNGIPPRMSAVRPTVWRLLLGYLPANTARRDATLARKRREYEDSVAQFFHINEANRTPQEQGLLHQILVDVPRTYPDIPFFQQNLIQRAMERVLYIWAIRHPASGYVQGISEIICPFLLVFFSAYIENVETIDMEHIDPEVLTIVEADTYWCTTKLLDNIQDHYTAEQPGLQRMLARLEDLVRRIDGPLYSHLMENNMMIQQFAFKWMNCLLLRELPIKVILRVWDTYFSQDGGFDSFHTYFCTALLVHFSSLLQKMEFQELMSFLQELPTNEWTEKDIEPLLSQAFIYSTLFEDSPHHLA